MGTLFAGLLATFRGPRQVWDARAPGHSAEFLALGFTGVAVDGVPIKAAQRVDLGRGEVEAFVRRADGTIVCRDGKLVREVLRGRVELLRGAE